MKSSMLALGTGQRVSIAFRPSMKALRWASVMSCPFTPRDFARSFNAASRSGIRGVGTM